MSKIIKAWPEDLNRREVYKFTRSNAKKISEIAGSIVNPSKWVLFEDEDIKTGEIKTVLVLEDNGEMFGTISNTFIKAFTDAVDELGEELGAIKIVSGTSKSGREFVTCEIV